MVTKLPSGQGQGAIGLTQVHTGGSAATGQFGIIVDDQRHAGIVAKGRQVLRLFQPFWLRRLFFTVLYQHGPASKGRLNRDQQSVFR